MVDVGLRKLAGTLAPVALAKVIVELTIRG